jgi:hypothetical protein
MTPSDVGDSYAKQLDALLTKAKERDECEYILSLLRVRGEQAEGWDPLGESHEAVQDYLALINAPLQEVTKVRLGLLTYCHITEIDAVYELLANMLVVTRGDRYSMIPFANYTESTGKPARDPIQRIDALKEMEGQLGGTSLASMFETFFNNKVRNAFYHSNYMIHADEFRYFDKGRAAKIPLGDVMSWVGHAIAFYLKFVAVYIRHRTSYTEPKIITGRLAPGMNIKVLVEPGYGVVGLEAGLGL